MEIKLEENPFYIFTNCCSKFQDGTSNRVKKLEIKNGLILCPECRQPLTGKLFLHL